MPRFDLEFHYTGFWAVVAWIFSIIAFYGGLMRLLHDIPRLFWWVGVVLGLVDPRGPRWP